MKLYIPAFKKKLWLFITTIAIVIFLSSCYSVRIVNRDGVPEPDPLNKSGDFYKGKKVHVLDTVISLKLQEGEFSLIENARRRGFIQLNTG